MQSQDSATTRLDHYIVDMLPWAHGHQRKAIRDFVQAIITQETGCQAQLARHFGNQEAATKRLSRLLHNERLEPRHLADAVLLQALVQLPAHGPVRLAIDWTIEGQQYLLVVSLIMGRRAVPIYWRAYDATAHVQGAKLNYPIFARAGNALWDTTMLRYDAVEPSDDRRCIMAIAVQQIRPVAHLSLVLGVLRRLEVASLIDNLIPPDPGHVLSSGRGVAALVLAVLDGDHALYKVGQRLDERGLMALLQPGLTRASLHDYRLGHILDALFAANLNTVFSAVALKALEVY